MKVKESCLCCGQVKLEHCEPRAAAEVFDRAGHPLRAAEQLADLCLMHTLWDSCNTAPSLLSITCLTEGAQQDLQESLARERRASGSRPDHPAKSALHVRCLTVACLANLRPPPSTRKDKPSLDSAIAIMEEAWNIVQSGDTSSHNIVLQALIAMLAVANTAQRMRRDLEGKSKAPTTEQCLAVEQHLAPTHQWLERLKQTFARLTDVLDCVRQGRLSQGAEDFALLDGCWALLGLTAHPHAPTMLSPRPTALAMAKRDDEGSVSLPWLQKKLKPLPDGSYGVPLVDAALVMHLLLRSNACSSLWPLAKLLRSLCERYEIDIACKGPGGLRAWPWAGVICHAAYMLMAEPLHSMGQATPTDETSWTFVAGIILIFTLPELNPAMQLGIFRPPRPSGSLAMKHGPLPRLPSVGVSCKPGYRAHAHCSLMYAAEHLHCGLTASVIGATDGFRRVERRGRPAACQYDVGFASWAVEAVHAVYQGAVKGKECEGYPSPFLLLDLAERATLVSCGVTRRWHIATFPKKLAILHLTPLQRLLSFSLYPSTNPTQAQSAHLQVPLPLIPTPVYILVHSSAQVFVPTANAGSACEDGGCALRNHRLAGPGRVGKKI
jgi:hypothetical protein